MDVTRTVRVELSIEHLVLEGVPVANGFALKLALERELSRLIAERGTPPGWQNEVNRAALSLSPVELDHAGTETRLASTLANALYEGLST